MKFDIIPSSLNYGNCIRRKPFECSHMRLSFPLQPIKFEPNEWRWSGHIIINRMKVTPEDRADSEKRKFRSRRSFSVFFCSRVFLWILSWNHGRFRKDSLTRLRTLICTRSNSRNERTENECEFTQAMRTNILRNKKKTTRGTATMQCLGAVFCLSSLPKMRNRYGQQDTHRAEKMYKI